MNEKMKLTAAQQEVVNLMAAGYVLAYHQGVGRNSRDWATLRKSSSDGRKVNAGVPSQLRDKGVIDVVKSDWRSTTYGLTELGESLVRSEPTEPPATFQRWCLQRHGTQPSAESFVRETADCLFNERGDRTAKSTQWYTYYDTREDAIAAVRKRLESELRWSREAVERAEAALAAFNAKEPGP